MASRLSRCGTGRLTALVVVAPFLAGAEVRPHRHEVGQPFPPARPETASSSDHPAKPGTTGPDQGGWHGLSNARPRERMRTPWVSGANRVVLDGRERRLLLDLPAERPPKAPLVLAFHGFTGTPDDLRQMSGLSAAALRRGWVVAYPEGTRDDAGRRFFQVGYQFHRKLPVDDLQAARELATRLVQDLDLNPQAVFVTGFSNGADLSFLLGSRPNPFARAIAPVCGTMMSNWSPFLAGSAQPSVLAVNAVDDPITRWSGDLRNRDGWGAYWGTEDVV